MIDMEQLVETRWGNRNIEHLKSRGYTFTKMFDPLMIKISDLTKSSGIRIYFNCDICGKQLNAVYSNYCKSSDDMCLQCANKIKVSVKRKISFEKVREVFESRGYELISNDSEYINSKSVLRYICKTHGEQSIKYNNMQQGQSCLECVKENRKGSNSIFWKGGITLLNRTLRMSLSSWSQEQLRRAGYVCELTGKSGVLNVHHMYRFSNIVEITMQELNMDIKPNIGDYSDKELQLITVNFLKNNELLAKPIVMLESVHTDFHSFCGGCREDTSFEQLEQFKVTLEVA